MEQEVSSNIRASAHGLFMAMVNGVGAWVGSILSGMAVDYFSIDGVKNWQTIRLVFAACVRSTTGDARAGETGGGIDSMILVPDGD